MSAKAGIFHDYDLQANYESSAAGQVCEVCDVMPMSFQWSDYSGEAMCTQCGAPYQLKWGSDAQVKEGKYPYPKLLRNFVPIAREFWNEQKLFVHYGMSFEHHEGLRELNAWIAEKYPESTQARDDE